MVTELKNPGFEGITRPGGYNKATPQMDVPEGWEYWSLGDEPEMNVIGRVAPFLKPPRLMDSGNWATKIFKSFGKLNCGLKQVVTGLTPGKQYEFGIWAHAWSAHQAEGLHKDGPGGWDAAWSAGVGYGTTPMACDDIPALNGNAWNDAIGNVRFWCFVKIDGVTQDGKCIVIYNAYSPVPPVRFIAPSNGVVEVGFGIQTLWRFNTGDGYFDNAYLVEVGDEPTPCKGLPRVQYERTYVLYPPGTSLDEKHMLLDKYPNSTLGPSADDAGQGDLDVRNVIAYNPGGWPGDLKAFLDEWYPGVNYSEVGSAPVPPPVDFLLSQRNPIWANEKLAGRDCTSTIGGMGCWVSCCGMSQIYLGIDKNATPSTVNKLLGIDGFDKCSTKWSAMNRLGLEVIRRESNAEVVRDWLSGEANVENVAFVRVWLPGEHWLFVYDYDAVQGDFRVADPWKNVTGYLKVLYPAGPWENGETPPWRLVRKLQVTPPVPPTPQPVVHPVPHELFGLHLQNGYRGDMEFIAAAQPSVVKLVGNFEKSRTIKANSPNTLVVARYHTNDQRPYYEHPDGPDAGAAAWYANWGDALEANAEWIDLGEGLNEEVPTHNDEKLLKVVAFEVAWCKLLEAKGFPVRPLVLNGAIGNPDHGAETRLLIPAAREAARCGGAVSYHAYLGYNWAMQYAEIEDDSEAYHFSMRALWDWDVEFVKAGIYVDYIFSESGPIYLAGTGPGTWHTPDPMGGWKLDRCMHGDFETFMRVALVARARWAKWNTTHGNRLRGTAWFTLGGPGFSNFEYGPYLAKIAEILRH